ncbi:discoidin domain-containing protein [Lysinibacillus xylanilyticus]|uniref:discoidin domain-containing protein n=1 Tax=Lysinibacillus xylanilyticus TaxID=582475 RepID=UPI00381574CE
MDITVTSPPTTVIPSFSNNKWGLTVIDDEIFISQYQIGKYPIEVYDANTFVLKRSFTVPNVVSNNYGSLGTDGVDLYVGDNNNKIIKVNKSNGAVINTGSLSINLGQTASFCIDLERDIIFYTMYTLDTNNIVFLRYSDGKILKLYSFPVIGSGAGSAIYKGSNGTAYAIFSKYMGSNDFYIADISNGVDNLIFKELYTSNISKGGIFVYKENLFFVDYLYKKLSKISLSSLYNNNFLLQSNNKTYSLKSTDIWYETKMTSDNAPAPLVASAISTYSSSFPVWKAFDGIAVTSDSSGWLSSNATKTGWIQLKFGSTKTVNRVMLTCRNVAGANEYMPKSFILEGSNDGTKYDTIGNFKDIPQWILNESRIFTTDKKNNYSIYRINVTENYGANNISFGEIKFGYASSILYKIPILNKENFINYGESEVNILPFPILNKNYLLQDKISKNDEGLWTSKLDRKPLSIGFN